MENYLLSVDGGGTKTEFCVSDGEGNLLHSIIVGCSNYKSVGTEGVYESLLEGLTFLREKGINAADIGYSVWGISGCDSPHDYELVNAIIDRLGLPIQKRHLCNDGILAFYAQADEPGIVIIAGTGSIILGLDKMGKLERAGGWGYNISDIGSGYWIGAEILKKTLLYCDGCGGFSPLFDLVREYFKCESFKELPFVVTEVFNYYEIAKLARLAVDAAKQKEEVSLCILREGAGMLAALTESICRRLEFHGDGDINIVFSGGVLKDEIYRQLVQDSIKDRMSPLHITFLSQENAPVYGGIKLAKRLSGRVK